MVFLAPDVVDRPDQQGSASDTPALSRRSRPPRAKGHKVTSSYPCREHQRCFDRL